ncbi:hypothetical protein L596_007655 [Steinernema carpocapsae]|uniref:Uncharacterized protein n=1 Tax=Steinernema carpocapsae TaxID=34508 RepID=A0A4U5PA11_STECR|nr:hypothetical protein L596_007655 [Steinernema carpocapsae]
MTEFAEYVSSLQWDQTPDYEKIQEIFKACMGDKIAEDTPFDWELRDKDSTIESCEATQSNCMKTVKNNR